MMPEQLPSQPERSELDANQYEVDQLVALNDYIHDVLEPSGQIDWGLEVLYGLGRSIARRDPQIGHMLVTALESQEGDKIRQTDALIFSDKIRGELGLPQRWPDTPAKGSKADG